jgi:molecular chaperone DnaK
MSPTKQKINQKIFDEMTQIQIDLEKALKNIFEQAGSKIKPEKQEAVKREVEDTKQLIEWFKSTYL